jgi:hypothetical protein
MSVEFPFESHHIKHYTNRAQFNIGSVIIIWLILLPFTAICWEFFATNSPTDQQCGIVAGLALVVSVFSVSRTSKESRRIAREVLDGNLIEPEHPRFRWGCVFTHVHPSDTEMGRPILRFDPSKEITAVDEDDPIFFMTNVECISSTSQTKWDSYTEWHDSGGFDEDHWGRGSYREVSYSYTEYTPVFQVGEFEFESTTRSEYVVGDAYHLLVNPPKMGEKIIFHIRQRLDAKKT